MDTLAGRSGAGFRAADLAIDLSPLDPLLYAMRATKALARIVDGDDADAARLAEAAARTPGAHVDHRDDRRRRPTPSPATRPSARHWTEAVRRSEPDANRVYFFECLPIRHAGTRARVAAALARRGF